MLVKGGYKLSGEVSASGAKNAALPLLFSTLLAEGKHVFHNVPVLKDVESTTELLSYLGCEVTRDNHTLIINVKKPSETVAQYDVVRKMRASTLCMGPLLSKYGSAQVSLPGGCAIGTRPINFHLEGFKALGAEIEIQQGYVLAKAKKLKGDTIIFETPSVGATENLLMAASLADGTTFIENAAKEPEVVDLANYLIKMGAKIEGVGTSILKITGVEQLKPAEHAIIADRIEAGTLLIAGAICKGEVTVNKCRSQDLEALILKLRESGFKVSVEPDTITIHESSTWRGVDITTAPHPAFPTDLQAQFMALMTLAQGTSVITETVFENRFMHVQELTRLGADITPKTRVAIVRGSKKLIGAPVMATDLRASASLVLAGLAAEGETIVNRIYHLDRENKKLEEKLKSIGAKISRIK
ncbi:MAG: UDP-N-acetylglucosamine 1-carboxyvinyltransferase [Bdellovibrionales bacterium]|nr:UDP-N-acetylglucosamine 1-carboxyvinyltransferase [Bdellovibrionales bacterium]